MISWFLGLVADISAVFDAVKVFIIYGVLGAFATAAGIVAYWLIGRVNGLLAAILIGGLIVGGVSATSHFERLRDARLQAKVDSLEAQKAKLEGDLALANESLAAERTQAAEASDVAAENEKVMARLKAIAEARKGVEGCGMSAEELEEVRKIR